MMNPETLISLVVAISFAAGLNVYLTILTLGIAARMNWAVLPSGLHAISEPWVMVASAILFAGGFVADKIPGFDLVWNAAHTFIRVPLAALMAFAAGSHLSPEMQALVTVMGGSLAMLSHSTKTAARVLVTPSPEPFSNIGLSSAEDVVAVGLTGVALHHATGAAMTVGGLVVVCLVALVIGAKVLRRIGRGAWEKACLTFRRESVALTR